MDAAADGSAQATRSNDTPWARAWAASSSGFPPPAASPTTVNRSGLSAITSSA